MEQFAWLSQLELLSQGDLLLATGPGFVTMEPSPGAYASVADLREGRVPGALMSSAALISLVAGAERRYVMVRRDAGAAISPGKWQFPAGRCAPDELPLLTACRELAEEVRITGEVTDWRSVQVRVGGNDVTLLTQDVIHSMRARYVLGRNTVEFYYPMELSVSSFDSIELADNEPHGREVALLTLQEVATLAGAGQLTNVATAIFEKQLAAFVKP